MAFRVKSLGLPGKCFLALKLIPKISFCFEKGFYLCEYPFGDLIIFYINKSQTKKCTVKAFRTTQLKSLSRASTQTGLSPIRNFAKTEFHSLTLLRSSPKLRNSLTLRVILATTSLIQRQRTTLKNLLNFQIAHLRQNRFLITLSRHKS